MTKKQILSNEIEKVFGSDNWAIEVQFVSNTEDTQLLLKVDRKLIDTIVINKEDCLVIYNPFGKVYEVESNELFELFVKEFVQSAKKDALALYNKSQITELPKKLMTEYQRTMPTYYISDLQTEDIERIFKETDNKLHHDLFSITEVKTNDMEISRKWELFLETNEDTIIKGNFVTITNNAKVNIDYNISPKYITKDYHDEVLIKLRQLVIAHNTHLGQISLQEINISDLQTFYNNYDHFDDMYGKDLEFKKVEIIGNEVHITMEATGRMIHPTEVGVIIHWNTPLDVDVSVGEALESGGEAEDIADFFAYCVKELIGRKDLSNMQVY